MVPWAFVLAHYTLKETRKIYLNLNQKFGPNSQIQNILNKNYLIFGLICKTNYLSFFQLCSEFEKNNI